MERSIANDRVECPGLERRALEFAPDSFENGLGSKIHVRGPQSKGIVLNYVHGKRVIPSASEAVAEPSDAAAEI